MSTTSTKFVNVYLWFHLQEAYLKQGPSDYTDERILRQIPLGVVRFLQ